MSETPRYILAPHVPTPTDVVERMIRLANVEANDVVYDLGCGDGRLVIAAASMRGAHGVGVDIESYWAEQSRLNAAVAGVSHLVHFKQQDAFAVDLTPATVIFLYLVQWSTQLVAAHIRRQVSPGTRIVSHSFGFDSIFPALSDSFVDSTGQPRTLHLWVVESEAYSALSLPERGTA